MYEIGMFDKMCIFEEKMTTLNPQYNRRTLAPTLISEEHSEVQEALQEGDVVHLAKELADLVIVVLGTAHAYNIPFQEVFNRVYTSNMSKFEGAQIREDGKLLKGPNYIPPYLDDLFQEDKGV